MKLYSAPISPFAARVRLSIYRKGLNIDIVLPPEGGLKGKEYLTVNPMGLIPTLVLDSGFALPESATIIEYLEDIFPTPSLRPNNAEDLAIARLFFHLSDFYLRPSIFILGGMRDPAKRNEEVIQTAIENFDRGLSYIEHYLGSGTWAVGEHPSIADCALVPMLNIVSWQTLSFGQPDLIDKHKNLGAYWNAAKSDAINAKVIAEQLAAIRKP